MDPPTFSLFPSNYSNILSLCQKRQKEAFSKEVPKKSRKKRIQNLTSDKTEISRRIFFENHGNQNKSRLPFRWKHFRFFCKKHQKIIFIYSKKFSNIFFILFWSRFWFSRIAELLHFCFGKHRWQNWGCFRNVLTTSST